MNYLPCPFCQSSDVRRSRRRNLLEQVVLRLTLVRPYRCGDCNRRFYGRRRLSYPQGAPSRERLMQATAFLLAAFLFIPLVWSFHIKSDGLRASVGPHPAAPSAPRMAVRLPKIMNTGAQIPLMSNGTVTPFTLSASSNGFPAQRTPLGAMRVNGEVFVNGTRVEREGTAFIGDAIRTGPTGAVSILINGRGRLLIAARTEIVLAGAPRYLVLLEAGTVALNAQADAQSFQIRVGGFLVVPSPEAAAIAEIERAADGSARITCMSGSVGVIALDGEEAVFLRAGQSGRISADGRFSTSTPSAPAPPPEQPRPSVKKGGVSKGVIVLLVAGGGAAGAAAALAGKKDESQPVSPSQP